MIDLAIIPARAGSKGLPGKNIKPLGSLPLIGWTIRAAQKSGIFKRIIVSTDGPDIAHIAQDLGAEIPFMRPDDLATDSAGALEMMQHALSETQCNGSFMLLQPTSPFRDATHIKDAADMFTSQSCSAVISVAESKPLSWHFHRDSQGTLVPATQGSMANQRQAANQTVVPNGAIFVYDVQDFLSSGTTYPKDAMGYEMFGYANIDIDTMDDFQLAESILAARLITT